MSEPSDPTATAGPATPPEVAATPAADVEAVLLAEAARKPFGPLFFLTQLRAFVRDRCPAPEDRLPIVELRLTDGSVLDLCHVIGVAPGWVALAVSDEESPDGERGMRTDFVPYGTILRVTVRPSRGESPGLGFSHAVEPSVMAEPRAGEGQSAEEALHAAACHVP